MISEAVGKILGMAMAYGVSALGLFLAYVNYRKRTVGAERVMTPAAWAVLAAIALAVAGGVFVVTRLAAPPGAGAPAAVAEAAPPAAPPAEAAPPAPARVTDRWPLVGVVAPLVIFLFATWITVALYRHFSRATT
jgi:hypothetical protein